MADKKTNPLKPVFSNTDAEEFWDDTMTAYPSIFTAEDTFILVLAAEAWGQYRVCYDQLLGNESDSKLAALVCKWYDRVYKLLVALGMTPCQRKNLNIPPTYDPIGAVERRPGGSKMDEDDDE